jgi:hypothetical protein
MFKFNVTFACGFDIIVKARSAAEARDAACEEMELAFGESTAVVSVAAI